jgi:hypothetical protein
MWHDHPHLKPPSDDTQLWRYLDFAKFVSILDKSALYFANLLSLGDPYEGVETRAYLEYARLNYRTTPLPPGATRSLESIMEASRAQSRGWIFVSCWHMNVVESAAMWSQYLKSGEGVAIRSTFGRFRDSFAPMTREVMGGVVDYLDYETDLPGSENPIRMGCSKRKSFEHEREFRGIVFWPPKDIPAETGDANGIYVPVSVATLIQDIFVAPHAPAWQADLVTAMLQKYGLSKDVFHSKLFQRPEYLPPVESHDWLIKGTGEASDTDKEDPDLSSSSSLK